MKKVSYVVALIAILIINTIYVSAGDYRGDLVLEYDGQFIQYKSRLVDVFIDDQEVKTGDMPAVIIDSRTLVPVREVFESEQIGANVQWNGATQEVYISYLDQFIVLKIDSTLAYVNGVKKELDVPAKLVRDGSKQYSKTMIPLRFVAEQMGYDVQWDQTNFIANLYSAEYLAEENPVDEDPVTVDPVDENETGDGDETPTLAALSHDLMIKNQLEFMPKGDWVEPDGNGLSVTTSLKTNPKSYTATESEAIAQTKNEIVTDIENIEADFVEIYNLKFYYDETTPEKVTFEVSADGPISGIITDIENNTTMELYILKATLDMNTTEFEYDDHPFVDSLAIIEYTGAQTGNRNCVIRFQLNDIGNIFNVRMNETRQKIYIDAVMHQVNGINIGQNSTGDYIDIKGVETDQITAYRPNSNRISFDIDRVNTMINKNYLNVNGQFIENVLLSQKDNVTTNITVDLMDSPQYEIVYPGGNKTRIQFTEKLTKGVGFTTGEESVIRLDGLGALVPDINDLVGVDDYWNETFIVTIPGNHIDTIGTDKVEINSEGIDDVQFKYDGKGNTVMTIKNNKIQGVEAGVYGDDLVFQVKDPQDVYDRIITVDPGHGGYKPGAVASGVYEKDINLDVSLKLKDLLDVDGNIKTYWVRTDDSHVSLADRAILANSSQSDLFLSIHANSYWQLRTGTESLYMDRETNNGYSNYDFAKIMYDTFVQGTKFIAKKMAERPDLYVLKYTEMPAVLLEMGYMSYSGDRALLLDEDHQYVMAEAIYDGIKKVFTDMGK